MTHNRYVHWFLYIAFFWMLSACGGGGGDAVPSVTLQSISVTPVSSSIAKGLTKQLTATGTYSDGTSQLLNGVTWSSSAPSVATVNSTGLASGVSAGNAVILASFSGISGNATLAVTEAILQSIAVTPANPSVTKGKTLQLNAIAIYSDGSEQPLPNASWSSNNSAVASVNQVGLVSGISVGLAQIKVMYGIDFSLITVGVNPPPIPSPTLTLNLNLRGPNYPIDDNIEWSSTNAESCSASGSWSGTKQIVGQYILPIPSTGTYTLACKGLNGETVTKSVTMTLQVPVVTISVSPVIISAGKTSTLIWSATNNPKSCTASGSWSGSVAGSGNLVVKPSSGLTSQFFYYITCQNSAGTSNKKWAILNVF